MCFCKETLSSKTCTAIFATEFHSSLQPPSPNISKLPKSDFKGLNKDMLILSKYCYYKHLFIASKSSKSHWDEILFTLTFYLYRKHLFMLNNDTQVRISYKLMPNKILSNKDSPQVQWVLKGACANTGGTERGTLLPWAPASLQSAVCFSSSHGLCSCRFLKME